MSPICSAAIDIAANETNSPCGTKMTRVTANTMTAASASKA